MNEHDKIDFSALDPSRDPVRWEAMISSVVARAVRARRRSLSVETQLLAWSRPTLALAAALALVVWTGALLLGPQRAEAGPIVLLSQWAAKDEVPAPASILDLLGGDHGRR